MGFFGKKSGQDQPGQQSVADMMKMAQQMQADAMAQTSAIQEATAGSEVGSMTWARQVMSIIAPPEPGFVKRCSCAVCGAPKKLPSVTAYVYCDYCGSLVDYDLRRACDSDTAPSAEYGALVNGLQPQLRAAQAAGDRDTYRSLQKHIYQAYVTYVPNAVSHRAKNDPGYRQKLIDYLAEAAVVAAFDPGAVQLAQEMAQRAAGLRYSGSMMAMKVDPESFWPMSDTLTRQIDYLGGLNRGAGVTGMDPDHAEHLGAKMAWSAFCQGWLGMLPTDAAGQLLDRAGLKNSYVPVEPAGGEQRNCGGCGGHIVALPGATVVVCEDCGRSLDVGSAQIPCTNCGASITFPVGATRATCPYCKVGVDKVGIL